MKFIIKQKDLSKHIGIVQKAITTRSTLQILDGILIETNKDKLKLVGTDLDLSIETYVDCQIEREGSIVVNSRIFGDIVRKLPDAPIYIDIVDNNINIKCEHSEFNILGSLSSEYPSLPVVLEEETFTLPMDLFKSAIRQTVFATSQDEARPSLTGVLMELENKSISFVALDGYRLALKKLPVNTDSNISIIVPGRALIETNKILEDVEDNISIGAAPNHVIFNMGSTIVYSRLLSGQFFNYKDIIRKDHKTNVIVNKRSFQNALERASLLAKEEKANLIKLTILDNEMVIRSNSEIGNVNEKLEAQVEGEEINIAFNSRYLLEGIKIIDEEEISLNFMGGLNPCIINPLGDKNYTYLALPVRLAQEDF